MNTIGICALCGEASPLRASHIIPAFAFRWLKQRGPSKHIRSTKNPNVRIQDGLKIDLLCDKCEQTLSNSEGIFREKVFDEFSYEDSKIIWYDEWLIRFSTSLSWRALTYFIREEIIPTELSAHSQHIARAEKKWRDFLSGQTPNPGEFEQHILIFDRISETNYQNLSKNINRYLLGSIDLDILYSNSELWTFVKIGRFAFLGLVHGSAKKWEGTKIQLKRGNLKPRSIKIDSHIISYIMRKSYEIDIGRSKITKNQHAKINAEVMGDIDRLSKSDHYRALIADYELFGSALFNDK